MRILFVVNSYFSQGNGLDESARRTVQALRAAGQEVRVLSGKNFENSDGPQPEYPMEKFHFPLMQPMLDSFGYAYADWHGSQVEEAVRWADVIHLEETFFLHHAAMNWARKLGKPITGTYHVHPENIVYNCLGFTGGNLFCEALYRYWCRVFYDNYSYLQCPTDNVRERLERHHVKAKCFTLSNGVIPDKCIRPTTPPEDYLDENRPLDLIYIGRTAIEKDQPTLYKALRLSKYAKRIRLHIAGRGPKLDEYTKMAEQLYRDGVVGYQPIVGFYNREGLRQLAAKADLAVHCAFVEVEGMSITEALQQAVVPVIATAKLSGTATYALDDRSTYPAGDAQALANRIDYWFDHPQERWEMGFRYAESMKQYEIANCAQALIDMFQKAIYEKNHATYPLITPMPAAAHHPLIGHYGRTA
ncbi:MAG: glycosyltransferase [Paludibacteraceae bacterium]|nr:glycosyltransferase [Paludibacteraceae bacterium]